MYVHIYLYIYIYIILFSILYILYLTCYWDRFMIDRKGVNVTSGGRHRTYYASTELL